MQPSLLSWVVCAVLGFTFLLCLVAIIVTLFVIKYRNEPFITKRRLSVILGLNISIIFGMLSSFGIIYSQYQGNYQLETFWIAVGVIAWFSVCLFLNVKHWYQYYRYQWQSCALQQKWQQYINPNIVKQTNETNWYINNKHTYGNIYFIYKVFGILHISLSIICIVCMVFRIYQIGSFQLKIVFGVIILIAGLIPFIIYSIIIYKTKSWDDIYDIHWESKMLSVAAFILIIQYIFIHITVTLYGYRAVTIEQTLIYCSLRTVAFFAWLCIYIYIIYRQTTHEHASTSKYSSCGIKDMLDDILSDSRQLNYFMIHLSKEFNMECLLSVIEIIQFQLFVLEQMGQTDKKRINIDVKMDFAENIPMSIIMVGHESDDSIIDAKLKAFKLYEKYIQTESEFELNISGVMRNKIISKFDDKKKLMNKKMTLEDLLYVFEDVKKEMCQLLLGSLARFYDALQKRCIYQCVSDTAILDFNCDTIAQ